MYIKNLKKLKIYFLIKINILQYIFLTGIPVPEQKKEL